MVIRILEFYKDRCGSGGGGLFEKLTVQWFFLCLAHGGGEDQAARGDKILDGQFADVLRADRQDHQRAKILRRGEQTDFLRRFFR